MIIFVPVRCQYWLLWYLESRRTTAFHLVAELWMDPVNCRSLVAKQPIKIQGMNMPGGVCQVSIRSILQKLIFFHSVQFNFNYIAFAAIRIVSRHFTETQSLTPQYAPGKLFLIGKKNLEQAHMG